MSYYSINKIKENEAMDFLKGLFPEGEANELNFCLFSTSGIHGHYCTIEDGEEQLSLLQKDDEESKEKYYQQHEDGKPNVTFLVICPRIIRISYGNVPIENKEDVEYLKKLRASSTAAASKIGYND